MGNDSVIKSKKTIMRLFPYLEDKEKVSRIQIDEDSIYYISLREFADFVSNKIIEYLPLFDFKKENIFITDSTAGVGGNTISFAKNFKHVTAIEIEKRRSEYLKNNLAVYSLDNVTIINDDCLNVMRKIECQDVIFVDPPWGGKDYKKSKSLRLKISDKGLEDICNELFDENIMTCIPKILVLKLPKNYDIEYFYRTLTKKNIYCYETEKMIILIVLNKDKDK